MSVPMITALTPWLVALCGVAVAYMRYHKSGK